jgi:hypothetical protein
MPYMKILIYILIISQVWTIPAHAGQNEDIQVIVTDQTLDFDVSPIIENGRVLVPVRAVLESLGAEVNYDQQTREIKITREDLILRMELNSRVIHINLVQDYMEIAPKIIKDRMMVPLRFISEYLGYEITWNANTRIVTVKSKGEIYEWLSRIHMQRYGAPLIISENTYFMDEPTWSEPYSFSGRFEFQAAFDDEQSMIVAERTGRSHDGRFKFLTTGTMEELGETTLLHNEVIHEIDNNKFHIFESYLEDLSVSSEHMNSHANISMTVDVENLHIDSTDVSFTFENAQPSGSYTAHFDYIYEDVAPIEDIVVANTGLELLNDAFINDAKMDYKFTGEQHSHPIRIEGIVTKESQTHFKTFYEDTPMNEYYADWIQDLYKYRYSDGSAWKEWTAPRDHFFYLGNKMEILDFLNQRMVIPSFDVRLINGKETATLKFEVETTDWQSTNDLEHIIKNNFGIGSSWDQTAKAQFVFKINLDTKNTESMINTVTFIDGEEEETIISKYLFYPDDVGPLPSVE